MDLDIIMLNQISYTQRDKYGVFSLVCVDNVGRRDGVGYRV